MKPKDYIDELAREGEDLDPMALHAAQTTASSSARKAAQRVTAAAASRFDRPAPVVGDIGYADDFDAEENNEKESLHHESPIENSDTAIKMELPVSFSSTATPLVPTEFLTNSNSKISSSAVSNDNKAVVSEWDMREDSADDYDDYGTSSTAGLGFSGAATDAIKGNSTWDATPTSSARAKRSRWDETPLSQVAATPSETPRTKRSRWDETPLPSRPIGTPSSANSSILATPIAFFPATPVNSYAHGSGNTAALASMASSATGAASMSQSGVLGMAILSEMELRNQYMTDEDLDLLLTNHPGYAILKPPATYVPLRHASTPNSARVPPLGPPSAGGFAILDPSAPSLPADQQRLLIGSNSLAAATAAAAVAGVGGGAASAMTLDLPPLKQEDYQFFGKLFDQTDENTLSIDDLKQRRILRLLLKIKNGTPPIRKVALRRITEKARDFGPGPLFNQILPLLMSPSLEDQERHLLVKVIDRVMYKLDDLVRPFVHKILVVIEPLLIDEDYFARVEGREIISNLAKAAGLATMIATMRPDIDHADEYVRNTTARAFAVVACALGIPELLPFLKAVCRSKRSWQARHTGIKIIQQIALLMGCAVLPHLNNLVAALADGVRDEQQKVRTMTALAIAALAEASFPYGIESFDPVLEHLFSDLSKHRGKALAAFLKAIGCLIPLMDALAAKDLTAVIMPTVVREFQSPDEEMKKIVLRVIKQCVATDGVEPDYIIAEVLPEFFRHFWVRRMALDRRNYKQLVETTVELARKAGVACIVGEIVVGLKDESEPFRKMAMDAIEQIVSALGVSDVEIRLEQLLIDGVLFSFQEQSSEDVVMLNGFGTIVNALGSRVRPYLQQICKTILWRLNNKNAKVRQQAADLIARVAIVLRTCGEEKMLSHLGVVLYEYLGEEFPEVLGSILSALKAIVNVIGMADMNPPIKDLLPRLTPILRNRHEKVQENVIDLVGRIADRGSEFVSAREWMRICFELLDLIKAHKKSIRRATVNTFGYIAKAVGPQDVLTTLLNNLRVQERQNRVCTTVAIAIVAETCAPFTVLPGLMCEYRVPELNVQNGVLKSLSFMFEYIGEMAKDYVYAVTPLLEDALIDRDLVHRQTACTAVKHLALGVSGLGCEDALVHLLNHVWPNIFETSPHVINAVCDCVEALRYALGCGTIMNYVLAGLFHAARRVREIYWKIYNTMYISSQDAMIAYYPQIQSDSRRRWLREEILYF